MAWLIAKEVIFVLHQFIQAYLTFGEDISRSYLKTQGLEILINVTLSGFIHNVFAQCFVLSDFKHIVSVQCLLYFFINPIMCIKICICTF